MDDTATPDALRPTLDVLAGDEIERIVEQALEVLAETGVLVEDTETRELLASAGQRLDGERAFLDEAAVRNAVASAPGRFVLAGRDGASEVELGGREVCFVPGSAVLHLLDRESRRRRPPGARDLAHLAWVTDACRHLGAQSTALVPADVPAVLGDRYRLYVALKNGTKPIVTGTFRADAFAVMKAMLAAVRGGEEELRQKPLAVFDCCSTSPLKWSELSCQALLGCARSGIPAELISVPLGGATAPVTLREMVALHCAESLSGLLIHQLAASGAPVVWGGAPASFDMRSGTPATGGVETMLVDAACTQVGRHLGLPTHAFLGLSDAKTVDWQAGAESAMGALVAALSGINLVAGAGILDFIGCLSLEKLVLDNEACGAALRFARGIGLGSAAEAPALLRAVAEEGHFLAHRHTRRHFRGELLIPGPAIDRTPYGDWEKAGGHDAFAAATTEVDRVIAAGNPAPLDPDVERELDELMSAEIRRKAPAWKS